MRRRRMSGSSEAEALKGGNPRTGTGRRYKKSRAGPPFAGAGAGARGISAAGGEKIDRPQPVRSRSRLSPRQLQSRFDYGIRAPSRRARHGCGCSSGVEHNLAKVGVEGSNPFARSKKSHEINRIGRRPAGRLPLAPSASARARRDRFRRSPDAERFTPPPSNSPRNSLPHRAARPACRAALSCRRISIRRSCHGRSRPWE